MQLMIAESSRIKLGVFLSIKLLVTNGMAFGTVAANASAPVMRCSV